MKFLYSMEIIIIPGDFNQTIEISCDLTLLLYSFISFLFILKYYVYSMKRKYKFGYS